MPFMVIAHQKIGTITIALEKIEGELPINSIPQDAFRMMAMMVPQHIEITSLAPRIEIKDKFRRQSSCDERMPAVSAVSHPLMWYFQSPPSPPKKVKLFRQKNVTRLATTEPTSRDFQSDWLTDGPSNQSRNLITKCVLNNKRYFCQWDDISAVFVSVAFFSCRHGYYSYLFYYFQNLNFSICYL